MKKEEKEAPRTILGKPLPVDKKMSIALSNICGIGQILAKTLLKKTNIDEHIKFKDLVNFRYIRLRNYIETRKEFEGSLKKQIINNLQRLQAIKSYRGFRNEKNLPSRGQRTRSNAKTRKRNKEKNINVIKKLEKNKIWKQKKAKSKTKEKTHPTQKSKNQPKLKVKKK